MAAAGTTSNQSTTLLQRLDGELICGVCLELFTRPIMLPCSHNFCEQCIYGIIENGMSFSFISIGPPRSFNCPICQAVIHLNKLNQEGLSVNKALENIVALYKSCAPVDIFDSAWNSDLEVAPRKCEEHGELQDRFCDSCSITICSKCERTRHQSSKAKHRVEPLKHAAVAYQTQIADILTDLKKKLIPLNNRVYELENTLATIQGSQESISKELEQNLSALMSHLRQRQEGLKRTLNNEMLARQKPLFEELERCRAIKINVQELMRKLSKVRLTQDATLKLKLMKNTSEQLNTVLCFDIDVCLRNPHAGDGGIPLWDLNIQEVIGAINVLDWNHNDKGAVKANCKETGMQTVSEEAENLNIHPMKPFHTDSDTQAKGSNRSKLTENNKSSVINPSTGLREECVQLESVSPEQTSLDRRSFDEIDGEYPSSGKKMNLSTENGTKVLKKNEDEICVTETRSRLDKGQKLKQNGVVEQNHALDEDEDLNDRLRTPETASSIRTKGRSSFPQESTPTIGNKNSNGKPKVLVNKAKKSYSDKDLNKGERSYSPSNAEVLAKFVARRRTMSPSTSSPTLKALGGAMSDMKMNDELDLSTKKSTSSPALKSLNKTFAGTKSKQDVDLKRAITAVNSAGEHFSGMKKDEKPYQNVTVAKSDGSEIYGTEKGKIDISTPEKSDMTNTQTSDVANTKTDRVRSQSNFTNSQPDITSTKPEINNTQPDITRFQSDMVSVEEVPSSHHHKLFSKQPIGVNLDFNLGLDNFDGKNEQKRITEV